MYGWRARIGLLVAHVNTTAEAEFWQMAPEGVSIHTTRMRFPELTVEGLIAMGQETERSATLLADLGAAAICFCSTSGSFVKGLGYDQELMARVREATGSPAIATSPAAVEALRFLGLTKVALVSPHGGEVNQLAIQFLEGNGIGVTALRELGLRARLPAYPFSKKDEPVSLVGLQEPSVTYRLAKDAMTPDADGVFITCTNFRSIEVLDQLEQDLGVPVVSANQATFWAAMRAAGIHEEIHGCGSLLRRLRG